MDLSILLGIPGAILALVGIAAVIRSWARSRGSEGGGSAPPPPELPVAATPPPVEPVPPSDTPPTPSGWRDRPAALGDRLFGRAADLDAIDAAFEGHRWVVLAGGAGAGKSQLAAEWTQRAAVDGFWTTARGDANATVAALAPLLGIEEARPEDEVVAEVVRALGKFDGSETVWVVDTPESVALCVAVRDLASPGPRVLFTTRDVSRGRAPPNVGWWAVDPLASEDSVRLLKSRGYEGADEGLEAIAEAVGHLPLALELIAGLLGDGTWTPGGLVAEFDRVSVVQLKVFREDARTEGPQPNIERSEGVFATLTALLDALPEAVRERVAGLGYLADAPVPLDLLAAVCGVERDSVEWRELVEACQRRSVFRLTGETARVHALTAAAVAATQPDDGIRTALERTSKRLVELRITPRAFLDDEAHYRALLVGAERALPAADEQLLNWMTELAATYASAGRFTTGIDIDERVLATREEVLGEEHPDTLISRNNLATNYLGAGRVDDAIELHESELEASKRVVGEEHPGTLVSRNNLAASYAYAGCFDEAIVLYEQSLEAHERGLGEEHPDALTARNNLAESYRAAGRIDEAIALHERNLEVRERVLGKEHPNTLTARNNLATAYADDGRFDEAIPLLERTVEACERVLGDDHPNTLGSRESLVAMYLLAGRDEDAARLREAIGGDEASEP